MTRPSGSKHRSVTLLHISDPQFGRYHREPDGGTPADHEHQSLRAQLLEDIEGIEHEGRPVRPDIVVVTGDLSEQARPSELRAFEGFAVELLEGLRLPRERLVIVPGNHDVSWSDSEAYCKRCEAKEREPELPYWPKWENYADLFGRLYGGPGARFEFCEATPYTLFEYEDLHTVVAGLNSTMLETHRDGEHFGHVGTAQLHWFEQQLRSYRERGWLRIVAVHHNVMGGASPDENLRDAKELEQRLGDLVNLVLHGHTHDGALQWLDSTVPVASTGSAGVRDVARPHGVPCQYQLLRVEPDGLRQWTRAYQEAQGRWVGDVAASPKGDRWARVHPVAFVDLHGIFPPEEPDDEAEEPPRFDPRPTSRGGFVDVGEPSDFLARVAEICRLRRSRSELERRRKGPPALEYLELRNPQGEHVEIVPIGAHERGADLEVLSAFVTRVVPAYRQRDPGVRPIFVHGGPPASTEARQLARDAGVWLRSYEQHCGLIDFRRYRARLVERLSRDRVYPPSRYVGQRMVERIGVQPVQHDDALAAIRSWLDDPHGRFVLVLGTFGCGKTFLLRELARRLAEEDGAVVPILVEMRSLEKGLRLEQLLAQHFALHEVEDYSPARFMRMLADGRVALLFDGFDELVVRTTYPRAAEHFETIVSAARGRAKVVVSSRRQHFYSDHQANEAVRQVLMQTVETVPGHRVVTLQPFDDDQIERFLVGQLGDEETARERMRLIAEVRDLGGLSTNPRMLGFIAALSEDELRAARDHEGSVSPASLYRTLLRRWLELEHERRHPHGAPPGLTMEQRWTAVTELAVRLWTRGEHHVEVDALEQLGSVLTELAKGGSDEAGFQVGSGTLLVRDEDGRFSFIHESVMEWLVARAGAQALEQRERPELLDQGKMSPLLADFLIDLAGADVVTMWCSRSLGSGDGDNALVARGRLVAAGLVEDASVEPSVELGGKELRGKDLSGLDLRGANLSGTDLSGANLSRSKLGGANLRGAKLHRTDLSFADLGDADLHGADLRRASLLGAKLPDLEGGIELADLRWTKAIGAELGTKLSRDPFERSNGHGAAKPDDRPRPYVSRPFRHVRAIAASADGQLLAIADHRTIRLWDSETGVELRRLELPVLAVTAVAVDDESTRVAIGSSKGEVIVWDLGTHGSAEVRRHEADILGLSFDASGVRSVSEDAVYVDGEQWRTELGEHPTSRITAVAFSPSDERVVTGDATGRIIEHRPGRPPAIHQPHSHPITSIAIAADGTAIASLAEDAHRLFVRSAGRPDASVGLSGPAFHLAFPGPRLVVVLLEDGDLELIDLETSSRSRIEAWPPAATTLVAFGNDVFIASRNHVFGHSLRPDPTRETNVLPVRNPSTRLGSRLGPRPRSPVFGLAPTDEGNTSVLLWDGVLRVTPGLDVELDLPSLFDESEQVLLSRDGRGTLLRRGRIVIVRRRPPSGLQIDRRLTLDAQPSALTLVGRDGARLMYAVSLEHGRHELREAHMHDDLEVSFEHRGTVPPVAKLASSPDGRWVGAACEDRSLHFFSPLSHEALAPPLVLEGHRYPVTTFEMSDEPLAAAGSGDGTVLLFDLHAGKLRHRFLLPANATATVFGPEGLLAASSGAGHLQMWHVETGEPVAEALLHDTTITALAFLDPHTLAVGSASGTMELRRLPELSLLATVALLPEGWVCFTPDGRHKTGGRVAGEFWHAAGLCRFEVGELDEVLPDLRVAPEKPLFGLS